MSVPVTAVSDSGAGTGGSSGFGWFGSIIAAEKDLVAEVEIDCRCADYAGWFYSQLVVGGSRHGFYKYIE